MIAHPCSHAPFARKGGRGWRVRKRGEETGGSRAERGRVVWFVPSPTHLTRYTIGVLLLFTRYFYLFVL